MKELVYNNLNHVLFVLILISRLGDVISTYFCTPTLKLEGNPLVRKFGWRLALLSLLVCLIPYYNINLAIIALVSSSYISASNISKIWAFRAYGEIGYSQMLLEMAKKSKRSLALSCIWGSSFFTILAGSSLVFLSLDPKHNWGYWFGIGIISYGFVVALHSWSFFSKLFKKVEQESKTYKDENKI